MSRREKVLHILVILGYLCAVYLFLTAIAPGPGRTIGANPMAPAIVPLLVLAGTLNFMAVDAPWRRCLLNIQLFVIGCFLPPAFAVFFGNCQFYHAGLRFSIPPLCVLVCIFVLLLLLRQAQRKDG